MLTPCCEAYVHSPAHIHTHVLYEIRLEWVRSGGGCEGRAVRRGSHRILGGSRGTEGLASVLINVCCVQC